MSAIKITRKDLSISQLRAAAARTADAKQARRILAIAMVSRRMVEEEPGRAARAASNLERSERLSIFVFLTVRAMEGFRTEIYGNDVGELWRTNKDGK